MTLRITSLPMQTRFSEIIQKIKFLKFEIENETLIPTNQLSSRDLLSRTCTVTTFSKSNETYTLSAGLGLFERKRKALIPTQRAKDLLIRIEQSHNLATGFLLGLSIVSYPRVKAFYDLLLDDGLIVYPSNVGRYPFPHLGGRRILKGFIDRRGERSSITASVEEKIRENRQRYVVEPMISGGLEEPPGAVYNLDIPDLVWSIATCRAFSDLCGFGNDLMKSIFSFSSKNGENHLHLEGKRLFQSPSIRTGLKHGRGFDGWL